MGLQPSTHRKKVAHPVRWNPLFSLDKNTVAGDLPKCQGHSARTYTAAQGRTVHALFEKIIVFRDFSIDFASPQGSPGGFQMNF